MSTKLSLPAGLCVLLLVCVASQAQTNPCDLNHDGVVNTADVQQAIQMLHGLLQCTANIDGAGKCDLTVVKRVLIASHTGVCITGTPPSPSLASVSLSASVLVSGQSGLGTLTLNGVAGSGGVLVSLSASGSAVSVPANVEIAQGSAFATFPISALGVPLTTSAIVSASYSGVWATATVTVDPTPISLTGLSVTPGLLISGQSAMGTITMAGTAPPGGVSVLLSSTGSSVSFPGSVVVPQGSDTATFTLTAGAVSSSTKVQLTASYSGVNETITLTVDPPSVTLSWIPSTSPNVAGYNVYRGTISGGPYTQLNPTVVPGTSYQDVTVQGTVTYYYVTTSVDTSNNQSVYSNQAAVTIP